MQPKHPTTRKACIAITILAVAIVGAPAATAICVGTPPPWWPDGSCFAIDVIPPEIAICVSNNPIQDCQP